MGSKFRVGQVVAWIGRKGARKAIAYYRIESVFKGTGGENRYTFAPKSEENCILCPIAECIRELNQKEYTPMSKKPNPREEHLVRVIEILKRRIIQLKAKLAQP